MQVVRYFKFVISIAARVGNFDSRIRVYIFGILPLHNKKWNVIENLNLWAPFLIGHYFMNANCNCYMVSILQDSFYRGLTAEEAERVHEYNFDHPGNEN